MLISPLPALAGVKHFRSWTNWKKQKNKNTSVTSAKKNQNQNRVGWWLNIQTPTGEQGLWPSNVISCGNTLSLYTYLLINKVVSFPSKCNTPQPSISATTEYLLHPCVYYYEPFMLPIPGLLNCISFHPGNPYLDKLTVDVNCSYCHKVPETPSE